MTGKLFSIVTTFGLALALSACGGGDDDGASDEAPAEESSSSGDRSLDDETLACLAEAVGGTVEDHTDSLPDLAGIERVYRAVSESGAIDVTIHLAESNAAAQASADIEGPAIANLPGASVATVAGDNFWYVLDYDDAEAPTLDEADAAVEACM